MKIKFKKSRASRTPKSAKQKRKNSKQNTSLAKRLGMSFAKASPTMLFRTFILFCTLAVATVAIIRDAFDVNVWTFLANVLMYAALTKGQ